MAMMASATAGNPYDNFDNTEIEIEQDLIDPDDGRSNPESLPCACSRSFCQQISTI